MVWTNFVQTKSIEKSRNVKLENFIAALSIEGVGISAAKTISAAFEGNFDTLLKAFGDKFDWSNLEDIGEITSSNITKYFEDNEDEIIALASEMNFIVPYKIEVEDNIFKGKNVCITGSFAQSRDMLKTKLETKGAKVISGVSKSLDILFCGNDAGSKLTKAQTLGIKIIYEDELTKLLDVLCFEVCS